MKTRFKRRKIPLVLIIMLVLLIGLVIPQTVRADIWPMIVATPAEQDLWFAELTPNSTATLMIYESQGGSLLVGPESLPTYDWGQSGWCCISLPPGTFIVVTDDVTGITKELTIVDTTFDIVDIENDLAFGTAPPNADLTVSTHDPLTNEDHHINVESDSDGNWVANFGEAGFDILPYTEMFAGVVDDDGDQTIDTPPYFIASSDGWASVRSYSLGSSITIEVYDSPGGNLLFGPKVYSLNNEGGTFIVYPWAIGYYIVITDNLTNYYKSLILEDISLRVDLERDIVMGKSQPHAIVEAKALGTEGHVWLWTGGDSDGNWIADFGSMGIDLVDDPSGDPNSWLAEAWVYDQDGDSIWENTSDVYLSMNIDVKPGSDPNSINLYSQGVVPVAILTTEDFDATTVDPETVLFAGTYPLRWATEDVDLDGDIDLVFFFRVQELNLDENSTEAMIEGETFSGLVFWGVDTVKN